MSRCSSNSAQLEVASDQAEKAVALLREAEAQAPRDVELRYALATALGAAGLRDEAQQHYDYVAQARRALNKARDLIIRLNDNPPDKAKEMTQVGSTLLKYGEPNEAIVWLRSAINEDTDYASGARGARGILRECGQRP